MHGRSIFLVASLLLPIIASPAPVNHVTPRENSAIERRNNFSMAQLYRDLLKRAPLIEALPEEALYDVIHESKRSVSEETEDGDDDDDEFEASSEIPDRRRVKAAGGGPGKRRVKAAGGGPGKRRVKAAGGGPGKIRVKAAGGGPGKRRVKAAGGGPGKRRIKAAGGGPGR
ncbi:hypothetical protein EJ02DRAFT_509707 [Clathrospora elynae]|uniref:Uncharacterized protein n=1 Tax=Clathrospora elynae TaxID=706981 RepID=A0A6A5SWC5_9PLEO|nr:hypothetical protein EJ02DRAFT_509707 [Clathrospora elynae]